MKHFDEFSAPSVVRGLANEIARISQIPARIMEVCGGQTHAILRYGLEDLLPPHLQLLHGPGCPVCVTPAAFLDHAIEIARRENSIICTFGDLLRVPSGHSGDLFSAKASGADVRVVTSPLEVLAVARAHPDKSVVHLAIGFETTAPAHAILALQARAQAQKNVFLLTSQFLVPPILRAICSDKNAVPDAFLAAGHVCAVVGAAPYETLAQELHRPIVITGFEPADILLGVLEAVRRIESGQAEMVNALPRLVQSEGNPEARRQIETVFQITNREWRGLGVVPASGLSLRPEFSALDAEIAFPFLAHSIPDATEHSECLAPQVLRGTCVPSECPLFGSRCTPDHPCGAPMVSTEGACAAFFLHRKDSTAVLPQMNTDFHR